MMKHLLLFLIAHSVLNAFFVALTDEELIAEADLISVIEIIDDCEEMPYRRAKIQIEIYGGSRGDLIDIYPVLGVDKETGDTLYFAGRNPTLEPGKSYLVYLKKNADSHFVTVQSEKDAIEIVGDKVHLRFGKGYESLNSRIQFIQDYLSAQSSEQAAAGNGR